MDRYIRNLIDQGEHQQLDFKFEISDAKKIARTFSAFANTKGGILLVGVKDNGVISGIKTDEEDYMVESAAHLFCKPAVDYSTRRWNVDGKWVLEVKIPESGMKPTYARTDEGKWMAYVRIKDENFLANVVMLNVWKLKNQSRGVYLRYGVNEKKVLKTLKENEMLTSREIASKTEGKKYFVERILAKLISISVVEIIFSEHSVFYRLKSPDDLKY
ncbi:MAG: ATP-binding protein [Bacteroidales bacterium]